MNVYVLYYKTLVKGIYSNETLARNAAADLEAQRVLPLYCYRWTVNDPHSERAVFKLFSMEEKDVLHRQSVRDVIRTAYRNLTGKEMNG